MYSTSSGPPGGGPAPSGGQGPALPHVAGGGGGGGAPPQGSMQYMAVPVVLGPNGTMTPAGEPGGGVCKPGNKTAEEPKWEGESRAVMTPAGVQGYCGLRRAPHSPTTQPSSQGTFRRASGPHVSEQQSAVLARVVLGRVLLLNAGCRRGRADRSLPLRLGRARALSLHGWCWKVGCRTAWPPFAADPAQYGMPYYVYPSGTVQVRVYAVPREICPAAAKQAACCSEYDLSQPRSSFLPGGRAARSPTQQTQQPKQTQANKQTQTQQTQPTQHGALLPTGAAQGMQYMPMPMGYGYYPSAPGGGGGSPSVMGHPGPAPSYPPPAFGTPGGVALAPGLFCLCVRHALS